MPGALLLAAVGQATDAAGAVHSWLHALEHSDLGATIRQSVFIYPAANITHIVGLAVLAGGLAMLDLRLLGWFRGTRPADIIPLARRLVVAALAVQVASGLLLFIAEASHVAMNPAFQLKLALIAIALANALLLGRMPAAELDRMGPVDSFPIGVRIAAAASLTLWLSIAVLGRVIAYV